MNTASTVKHAAQSRVACVLALLTFATLLFVPRPAFAHDIDTCGEALHDNTYIYSRTAIKHDKASWIAMSTPRTKFSGSFCVETGSLENNITDQYMKTYYDYYSSGSWYNCAWAEPGWLGSQAVGWWQKEYWIPSGCGFSSRSTRARTYAKFQYTDGHIVGVWSVTTTHNP